MFTFDLLDSRVWVVNSLAECL